jgi:hypothetical protein
MALRKPLVLNSGRIQQLQAGDTLDAVVPEIEGQTFTNGDAGNHVVGDIVYVSAADTVRKAQANAAGTTDAIALATTTIANGVAGVYQTGGALGGLSGLTAGAVYYLSQTTAGLLTLTAPTTVGQYVVRIGVANSTTELLINIQPAILL